VDGPIRLDDIAGEIHLRAVDGSVEGHRLKARVKGHTVDGNITLERVEGGLDLHTVDGSIRAEDLDGWGEGIHLKTVDGGIKVRLGQARGRVEAKAMDGRIRSSVPGMEVKGRANVLVGTLPGRDQQISLRTVDGNIDID
jgi:DUF4097 and DUF4098 domain-containing protein YvlB